MIGIAATSWSSTNTSRGPLEIQPRDVPLSAVEAGDALVAFSKKRVIALAGLLAERGMPAAVIYGDLPPEVRRMQYAAFAQGERRARVSTDAIGMGVNLPIRRIVFTELSKYDGEDVRPLTSQEVKQIAGRAGRLGIYDVGYVASMSGGQAFLKARLEAEDAPVEQAVVGPSEALLGIRQLPLREKLALWSTREEALPCYRKMDVRDALMVLDRIARFALPERIQWQLILLPLTCKRRAHDAVPLYVEAVFVTRAPSRAAGIGTAGSGVAGGLLPAVNLYYGFSRAFGLPLTKHGFTRCEARERDDQPPAEPQGCGRAGVGTCFDGTRAERRNDMTPVSS
jgi:ATP-dependent RNA helicase SUPV3L1/SUV3